jgi:hypothetical protein
MTVKQTAVFNNIISALPDDCRDSYRQIAEYAVSLGYTPTIKGTRKDYADFSNSKLQRTILKIKFGSKSPYIEMKFYALHEFSAYFQTAIKDRIATWNRLKYDFRCFGCGKCDGTEGYTVVLPEDKTGFLCGIGLLQLPPLSDKNIPEIKEAMNIQNEFFINQKRRFP